MAKKRNRGPKKRRTREHIIADLAVNHLERHVLSSGHTLQRVVHDYGLDAIITTYSRRGEVENGLVWVQVKATDHLRRVGEPAAIAVRVERKDLLFWMGERYPVILLNYAAAEDTAYWLHIQEALQAGGKLFELPRSGTTLTIHVPVAQVLDESAVAEFRRLKAKAD